MPGWNCDIRGISTYEELPENCRKYIEFVEEPNELWLREVVDYFLKLNNKYKEKQKLNIKVV